MALPIQESAMSKKIVDVREEKESDLVREIHAVLREVRLMESRDPFVMDVASRAKFTKVRALEESMYSFTIRDAGPALDGRHFLMARSRKRPLFSSKWGRPDFGHVRLVPFGNQDLGMDLGHLDDVKPMDVINAFREAAILSVMYD